jgi:hypothetical protein
MDVDALAPAAPAVLAPSPVDVCEACGHVGGALQMTYADEGVTAALGYEPPPVWRCTGAVSAEDGLLACIVRTARLSLGSGPGEG